MNYMIEPWSEEERLAAFATFKKISENNRAWLAARRAGRTLSDYPMPHDIYESHRLTMKSVSTEVGIFDERGRIFLTRRPPANEDPAEPYPNQWHIPGTRHIGNETEVEAFQRLVKDEIGQISKCILSAIRNTTRTGTTGFLFSISRTFILMQ